MDLNSTLLKVASKSVKHGYDTWKEGEIEGQVVSAAELTAQTYSDELPEEYLDTLAERFIVALESESLDKSRNELARRGEPIPVEEYTESLRADAAPELSEDHDFDFEEAAQEFLRLLERELSEKDKIWRRILLAHQQEIVSAVTEDGDPVGELSQQGFTWLTNADFEADDTDPYSCWRRPMRFPEVSEGFALDRTRTRDGTRINLTEELVEELTDGETHVITGPMGSGKSTICRTVATRWYENEDTGPVFYRKSGSEKITDQDSIDEAIELARETDPVLIVVEDAVNDATSPIYELVQEYRTESNVSFLLEARDNRWDEYSEVVRRNSESESDNRTRTLLSLRDEVINQHEVPQLDREEVERFIDHFEEITGDELRKDAADLLQQVRMEQGGVQAIDEQDAAELIDEHESETGEEIDIQPEQLVEKIKQDQQDAALAWPSPVLLLTYHFPIRASESDQEGPLTLRGNVEATLHQVSSIVESDSVETQHEDLVERVALFINILNATDIGVHKELLYTQADTDAEFSAIKPVRKTSPDGVKL